ncbi:MAG: DivIVA domain-containing protein [Anaerovoracaceae bacterium]|jgi:cell division initiation protein
MITPLDIQNKEFSKAMRGYKVEDVDLFLDLVTLDLEKIIKENTKLKTENESLRTELEQYKKAEGEVVKVLEQAQNLMNDISKSAEKRADVILKNAGMDAELALREAKEKAQRLLEEQQRTQRRYESFRDRYRHMLEEELARIGRMDDDLQPGQDDNRLETLLAEMEEEQNREAKPEVGKEPEPEDIGSLEDLKAITDAPVDGGAAADDKRTTIIAGGAEKEPETAASAAAERTAAEEDSSRRTMVIDVDEINKGGGE